MNVQRMNVRVCVFQCTIQKKSVSDGNTRCVNNIVINSNYIYLSGNLVTLDALEIFNSRNKGRINKSWIEGIFINRYKINLKLDKGAELNALPVQGFNQLKNLSLTESNVIIKSFGDFMTRSKNSIFVQ